MGIWAAKLAFRFRCGHMIPKQLGPITRRPPSRAYLPICASISCPLVPASLPPAETMMAPLTPFCTHSMTIDGTVAMGVAITARSMLCSAFSIEGRLLRPWMVLCRGFTGNRSPSKPLWTRFNMRVLPTLSAFSLAPITAIAPGLKIRSRL